MFTYIIHRLLIMIPTMLVISIITFVIIQLPEGDYLSNLVKELQAQGEAAALDRVEFLRKQYGLDEPAVIQYGMWMGFWPGPNGFDGILQGNWGWAFEQDLPVSEVIGDRLFLSMLLNFVTILFIYVVSFPIGVYSATRQYSWGDYGFTLLGYLGLATPNFLLALIIMYFGNLWFGVSIGGLMDPEYLSEGWSLGKAVQSLLT